MPKKVKKFKNPITGKTRTITKTDGVKKSLVQDKHGKTLMFKQKEKGKVGSSSYNKKFKYVSPSKSKYESGGAKPIPKSMKVRGRRMGAPNVSSKKNGGYSYKDFLDL